jgi:SsrA-binding protein
LAFHSFLPEFRLVEEPYFSFLPVLTFKVSQSKSSLPPEIRNKKAFHDYAIEEKHEAGLMLVGTEVKSLRQGKAQMRDSFVRIEKGVPVLYHLHISEYDYGNINNHDPYRPRRLLMHKREISRLEGAVQSGGLTIIPLRIYFTRGRAKVEIALAKGKKLHDKRETMKRKEANREAERAVRDFQKGVR